MNPALLRARLEPFPRVRLGHLPTPLEPLPRLSEALGGPPLYIKRDDCTGLATGGNKTRKLEFLIGAARAEGADGVVSFGALQSNHARQTAAAAAKTGLACDLVLVENTVYREPAYEVSGNLLLDDLLGARVHRVSDEAAAARCLAALIEAADKDGRRLCVIPTGGSSAVGALGYVSCAVELTEQLAAVPIDVGSVFHATSSAGTQAGLLVGLAAMQPGVRDVGVNVYAPNAGEQWATLRRLCDETAALVGIEAPGDEQLLIDRDHLGPGYGLPTEAAREAIELLARYEGILLDPVYTGKAFAALVDGVRTATLPAGRAVVFLHTGGTPGLFAYQQALSTPPAAPVAG